LGSETHEKKLHLTFKKTRLKPGKLPNVSIQEEFIDWYGKELLKSKEGKTHLLFYDPVHQLHNTINGKCWQAKGGQNTIVLPSNTGRKRITILGAISPVNHKFTSITIEGMVNKEVTVEVLKNIRETYNDDKEIIIIMDNAKYNRAYVVQDIAKKLNITIKFLPPYSPNLNLIERVWKFLKKKLKNKYIEKFEDFKLWIYDFCKYFDEFKDEISKLISNNIQIIKAA
jgi:transposase